jgi:thiol-disulfide isomerase/thioredoxin
MTSCLRPLLALAMLSAVVPSQDPAAQNPAAKPQEPARPAAPAAAAAPKTLKPGMRLDQNLALLDIDGKQHRSGDYQGKVVVVNFFSIECPVQGGWDPELAAIQREFAAKGVEFLNIDSNSSEIGAEPPKPEAQKPDSAKPYDNIRKHLAAKKLPYTVLVDHGNAVADLFGAKCTPDIFVFGTDGRLVYRGLIAEEAAKGEKKQHLRDTLTKLLANEKVEPFQTTPQGCGIKRVPKAKPKDAAGEGKEKEAGK